MATTTVTQDNTYNYLYVTIEIPNGESTKNVGVKAAAAARKFLKATGSTARISRITSGGTHTPQSAEYRFTYAF